MQVCEKLTGCLFFNDKLPNMPVMSTIYKEQYCKGLFSRCARHMVALAKGKEAVPANLFPHQMNKALSLIK